MPPGSFLRLRYPFWANCFFYCTRETPFPLCTLCIAFTLPNWFPFLITEWPRWNWYPNGSLACLHLLSFSIATIDWQFPTLCFLIWFISLRSKRAHSPWDLPAYQHPHALWFLLLVLYFPSIKSNKSASYAFCRSLFVIFLLYPPMIPFFPLVSTLLQGPTVATSPMQEHDLHPLPWWVCRAI